MDSPETWRWIWASAALAFVVGEIALGTSLYFLPFAIGAAVATVLAFLDVEVAWEFLFFVVVSGASSAVLWPLGRRLDARTGPQPQLGSGRWVGRDAVVIDGIPAGLHAMGMVRIEREEWRAVSADGRANDQGARVRVVRVDGTRAVVEPVEETPAD
jgi:membrane protein implicated in regulation of membrane protease activity